MKEMREELNDALNEITLLTRIRNEEKRISSERYMQLHATKLQLDAGAPFSKDGVCLQIFSFSLLVLAGCQRTRTWVMPAKNCVSAPKTQPCQRISTPR